MSNSNAATHTGTFAGSASPNTVPVANSETKAQIHRTFAAPCSKESKGRAKPIPG